MEAQDWALLVLRAGAGLILVTHGFWHMKAAGHSGTRRLKTEGYRHATLQWYFLVTTLIGAGTLLILGLVTSLAAAALITIMVEAFWTVHLPRGLQGTKPGGGWDLVVMLVIVGFAIAILGPGDGSIDHSLNIAGDLNGRFGFTVGAWGVVVAAAHLVAFYRRPEGSI